MPSTFELKEWICEYGRRMWQRQFIAANDGNISVRLDDDEILVTPTGVSKGFMQPGDIITVNARGERRYGDRKPSSEVRMHLYIYAERSDIHAVVHAHPPTATAFAAAGIPMSHCALTEIVATLGTVPLAQYAVPGGDELPRSLEPWVHKADAILLSNHGVLTYGPDLETAYYRMEAVEHVARILLNAIQLGGINLLSRQQVDELLDYRRRLNIPGKNLQCDVYGDE